METESQGSGWGALVGVQSARLSPWRPDFDSKVLCVVRLRQKKTNKKQTDWLKLQLKATLQRI